MLVGSQHWKACCYPCKVRAVLPNVAFLATVVASTVAFHAWAGTPQMMSPTYVVLHSTLLGRKTTRPLRLMVRFVIWSPPLIIIIIIYTTTPP